MPCERSENVKERLVFVPNLESIFLTAAMPLLLFLLLASSCLGQTLEKKRWSVNTMHYAQDDEGAKDDEREHVDVIAVILQIM